MDLLANLVNSPLFGMAKGKIKSVFKDKGVKLITIELDANDELKFNVFTDEMKVMTETDFNNTIKTLTE